MPYIMQPSPGRLLQPGMAVPLWALIWQKRPRHEPQTNQMLQPGRSRSEGCHLFLWQVVTLPVSLSALLLCCRAAPALGLWQICSDGDLLQPAPLCGAGAESPGGAACQAC